MWSSWMLPGRMHPRHWVIFPHLTHWWGAAPISNALRLVILSKLVSFFHSLIVLTSSVICVDSEPRCLENTASLCWPNLLHFHDNRANTAKIHRYSPHFFSSSINQLHYLWRMLLGILFSVLFFIVYAQTMQCIVHVAQCPCRYASRYMHTFRHCDTAETGDVIRYRALKEAVNGHAQKVQKSLAWQGSSECTSCPCKNKSLLC